MEKTKPHPVFASWICIDSETNTSYFPSVKGYSSDASIQEVYWKCLAVCMYSARVHNPDMTLMLFTNAAHVPTVDGVNYDALMQALSVERHTTDFKFQTPAGYYENWRNQFYEFSIFQYITEQNLLADDQPFVLVDSDCVVNGNLSPLFEAIEVNGLLAYEIFYQETHKVNGLTRLDMKEAYQNLLQRSISHVPGYFGGEFFAATGQVVRKIQADFIEIWPILLQLNEFGKTKLNEEAQVLSFLFHKNRLENNFGNTYVRRIWTDPTSFRNVIPADKTRLIWHLPAEKKRGFMKMFSELKKINFGLLQMSHSAFANLCRSTFQIPSIDLRMKVYYLLKAAFKKLRSVYQNISRPPYRGETA